MLHEAFGDLVDDVAWYGAINGLAQLTWKLGAPGTADIYRGCELWDFSLVDPDNRRPVDFDARIALLRDRSDDWRSGAGEAAHDRRRAPSARTRRRAVRRRRVRSRSRYPTMPPSRSPSGSARRGPSPAHRA